MTAVDGRTYRFRVLRNVVIGVFIVALLGGMFLPLYTDEVGWRFQERAGIDGIDKLFSDICGPNTLAVPPFFMMPARYYSAFFNLAFADPFFVRLSGVAYALLWTVLLLALMRRIVADAAYRMQLTIIAVGLMALGVLPLLMVLSRPEQPVIIATAAALLIAWRDREATAPSSAGQAWWRSLVILGCAIIALSYHVKGVFLLPLFAVCLFFASRGKAALAPRLTAGVLLIAATASSTIHWRERLRCPDDLLLAELYARHNAVSLLANARSPAEKVEAIRDIIGNVSPMSYFGLPAPVRFPMSDWLAPDQAGDPLAIFCLIAITAVWLGVIVLALCCLVSSLRRSLPERRIQPKAAASLMLWVVVLAWSATQLVRNVYDAAFVLPLAMMGLIFALATDSGGARIRYWIARGAIVIGLGAIVSIPVIAATYGPSFARAAARGGYVAEQPFSVAVFRYQSVKPRIVALAKTCGIPDPAKAQGLMVDDLTYFAFMEAKRPQHHLGVTGIWRGSIKDPAAYLRSVGSDGAIVKCAFLPDELRDRARRDGEFCCLGAAEMGAQR